MGGNKGEASAKTGPAGDLFTPANNPAVSTTRTKTQRNAERGVIPPMPEANGGSLADWKAKLVAEGYFLHVEILEALGPVERIRTSAGIPLVWIGYHQDGTAAGVCPTRWRFGGLPFQFHLLPHGKNCSQAVINWALDLRATLGRTAEREQARFERIAANYLNNGGGR